MCNVFRVVHILYISFFYSWCFQKAPKAFDVLHLGQGDVLTNRNCAFSLWQALYCHL